VATRFPSGLNAANTMALSGPSNVSNSLPVDASHILAVRVMHQEKMLL
jgi:hypothetical protein